MNALQNGLKNGPAGGPPAWAGDDSPLLLLSPEDRLTLRQSFEGMFVTGQTGSGKTSGPGQSRRGRATPQRGRRPVYDHPAGRRPHLHAMGSTRRPRNGRAGFQPAAKVETLAA